MNRYKCPVCGYLYDPEIGDEIAGVEPGVAFEDLPSGWFVLYAGLPTTILRSTINSLSEVPLQGCVLLHPKADPRTSVLFQSLFSLPECGLP